MTAVSKKVWEMLGKRALQPSRQQLFGPAQHPLEALGQFRCHLTYEGKEAHQQVYVVNHLQTNVLGLPAITTLQLAARMDSCETTLPGWESKFPKVFKGLGTLAGDYQIHLKPDAR